MLLCGNYADNKSKEQASFNSDCKYGQPNEIAMGINNIAMKMNEIATQHNSVAITINETAIQIMSWQ